MIRKKYWMTGILCVLLCAMLTGCFAAKEDVDSGVTASPESTLAASTATPERPEPTEKPELTEAQLDAYQQMTLFIQEGFRTYRVEGSYEAYFSAIEEEDGAYSCNILLDGKENLWSEEIDYTYDAQTGWYTFEGQWEPILVQDTFWALEEDDSFVVEIKTNYAYKTQIAQKLDIAIPIHYYAQSGPAEHQESMLLWHGEEDKDLSYTLKPMIYTYQDNRLDVSTTIAYLQIYHDNQELEDRINEHLKEAFLLDSTEDMYSDTRIQYAVTRQDEKYLSIRSYWYFSVRGENHPSEGENAITIDMETGDVLTLQDVVGETWTPLSLFESGFFHCQWVWRDGGGQSFEQLEQEWMDELIKWEKGTAATTLQDYDDDFYLTEDSLGLITYASRYYTCIEAKLKDLGLEKFEE